MKTIPKRQIMVFFVGVSFGAMSFVAFNANPLLTREVHSPSTCPCLQQQPIRAYRQNKDNIEEYGDQKEAPELSIEVKEETPKQRKILLDCGANVASTVELFRNTYPSGREFVIHSFEIDDRLAPYFSPYDNHVLHCPEGVANKDGNMTAYNEAAWSPTRGKNNGKDMQWGGGSLFAFDNEIKDNVTGGKRKLSVRPVIPTVDLSRWIRENTSKEDYVIFKLDVEGAEFDILKKMLAEGSFEWIDKYYGEFHVWQPVTGWTQEEKQAMVSKDIKKAGMPMISWGAESRGYTDFKDMHPLRVPDDTPGQPGSIYSTCGTNGKKVAITVAVGMNLIRAQKIMAILDAYRVKIPVMIFVYGDFAQMFPERIKEWAARFDIGMREDGPYPPGHYESLRREWIREALVNSEMRLQETDNQPAFYLCHHADATPNIVAETASRGFRIIKPSANFPPREGTTLQFDNYYKYRDVERVPKALRILNDKLEKNNGGILALDTDLPDTRMNIVFLLDFLIENSGFEMVSVSDCVASAQKDKKNRKPKNGDPSTITMVVS